MLVASLPVGRQQGTYKQSWNERRGPWSPGYRLRFVLTGMWPPYCRLLPYAHCSVWSRAPWREVKKKTTSLQFLGWKELWDWKNDRILSAYFKPMLSSSGLFHNTDHHPPYTPPNQHGTRFSWDWHLTATSFPVFFFLHWWKLATMKWLPQKNSLQHGFSGNFMLAT